VFTAGFARWWPATHSIGAVPLSEAVIEPRVGGRWFERGTDGSECDWGRVLVWEPPHRVVLGWQIDANFKFDPDVTTEVEVRFVADGDRSTRVELEHRHLERLGPQGEILRQKVSSPQGWGKLLELYAATASA
jgi:uncharacterized protein YndB with AHSA1/START domain